MSILIVIILVTAAVSFYAFNHQDIKMKYLYIPYKCKHDGELYRVFTHLFLHADTTHLLFNMLSLYFLGNIFLDAPDGMYLGIAAGLEQTYGNVGGQVHFGILYFFGGLFATIIPYFRNQDNPNYLSLGASGAVSSVIFAAIIWNPTMKLSLFFIPIGIPAYIFGPLYIFFEIYMDRRGGSKIAHDAHIGGALFGIIYILFLNIEKGKEIIELIF